MRTPGPAIGLVLCIVALGILPLQARSEASEAAVDDTDHSNRAAGAEAAAYQRNLDRWRAMSESRRAALRQVFERYKTLPPEQQEELRRRYRWYVRLPEAERRLVQANFELLASASREELKTLKQLYRRYRRLPVEKQGQIDWFYRQWQQYPADKRRAFLREIGPAQSPKEAAQIARRWLRQAELSQAIDGFETLPPQRREELLRRYRWYDDLSEARQRLVRQNLELVTSATEAEMEVLKNFYAWCRQLPEEEQGQFKWFYRQWRKRSVADQRAFLRRIGTATTFEEKAQVAWQWLQDTRPAESTDANLPAVRPTP